MAQSQQTTDHEKLRQWVEEREGKPATVAATVQEGDEAGLLRIDFPGYSGEESLEPISWEDFFDKFEEKELAFLYQDATESGDTSRFFKFVRRTPK